MYDIDRDELKPLADVPPCDIGAPLPVVVATDYSLLLAYYVDEPDPNWDGMSCTIVTHQSEGRPIAIVRFDTPVAHMFGSVPDEETIVGHPLARRGLESYEAFEVIHSSWLRRLDGMKSTRPHHWPELLDRQRHFILGFHDSTFECIARGFQVVVERRSMADALSWMAREAAL